MKRFLLNLYRKMKIKAQKFPEKVSVQDFHRIKNFHDFDEKYTAPLNGFKSAEDYWAKASSKPYLSSIKTPTLMLSSEDDTLCPLSPNIFKPFPSWYFWLNDL